MVETYEIILWKKNEDDSKTFEEIAVEAYETLSVLQKFPVNFHPIYLKAESKKNAVKINWNYEEFREILRKRINKEGKKEFEELGYSVGFFSDFEESNTCGISIHVGNKSPLFVNSLIIRLPRNLNLCDCENVKMIKDLFKILIEAFKPFWGCVSNYELTRKYGRYINNGIPTTIHWMNYWSEEIIDKFGREKVNCFVKEHTDIMIEKGFFSIRDQALYADKEVDVDYQYEMHKNMFGK